MSRRSIRGERTQGGRLQGSGRVPDWSLRPVYSEAVSVL